MFFDLTKYLSTTKERIIYQFGVSLRFIIVVLTLWTIVLGGLSYALQWLNVGEVFERAPLAILILIIFYYVVYFITTVYIVTDLKIYKRVGIGFVKVTSAKHTEIDDMKVQQSFLEKILFGCGTLKFNTPGSDIFEIVLERVNKPFAMKQELYDAWEK